MIHRPQQGALTTTIKKLKQIEELLVLMWMSEHMRPRANKIQVT